MSYFEKRQEQRNLTKVSIWEKSPKDFNHVDVIASNLMIY